MTVDSSAEDHENEADNEGFMEEGPQNIGRNEGKFAPACSSKLQSSNLLKNYAGCTEMKLAAHFGAPHSSVS